MLYLELPCVYTIYVQTYMFKIYIYTYSKTYVLNASIHVIFNYYIIN